MISWSHDCMCTKAIGHSQEVGGKRTGQRCLVGSFWVLGQKTRQFDLIGCMDSMTICQLRKPEGLDLGTCLVGSCLGCDTTWLGNLRLQDYLGGLGGQKARWGGPDYWSNPLASVNRVFRIFDDPFRLYPILPEVLLWAFVSLFDFWLQVSLQELQDFFKDCGHIVEAACKLLAHLFGILLYPPCKLDWRPTQNWFEDWEGSCETVGCTQFFLISRMQQRLLDHFLKFRLRCDVVTGMFEDISHMSSLLLRVEGVKNPARTNHFTSSIVEFVRIWVFLQLSSQNPEAPCLHISLVASWSPCGALQTL